MKKTMIGILAGNGPKSRLYESTFKTFQTNEKQDMIVFYPEFKFKDWNLDPKIGILVNDGGPFKTPVVPTIRNNMIDYAIDKGYEVLFIVDDDIRQFNSYDIEKVKASNSMSGNYEKNGELPEITELYGGIIGANFKLNKIQSGKYYSNQIPYSCIYLNLKMYKEKYNIVPKFEINVATWDDFDFALQMRQLGVLPQTFNNYAFIKTETQDQGAVGKSLAANIEKANRLGYELYKKHYHCNTIVKVKVNIIDVHPSLRKDYLSPGFMPYKYRVDTYEHWVEDILKDPTVRKSEKKKQIDA